VVTMRPVAAAAIVIGSLVMDIPSKRSGNVALRRWCDPIAESAMAG
jgi:hypothetical protein